MLLPFYNVILVDNPGVGKTHTDIALGVRACIAGKSVLYITVSNLITELKESMTINQLTSYKKNPSIMTWSLLMNYVIFHLISKVANCYSTCYQ